MKYKIRNKLTGEFISNYEDHSDRAEFCIGTFGIRPDGELVFFEIMDGGMDEVKCPNLEVVFTHTKTDKQPAFTAVEGLGKK